MRPGLLALAACLAASAQAAERSRDLGILIGRYEPGPLDAITDVPGVRVGQTTLVSGAGALIPGTGPVRTGVTVILPAEGDIWSSKVPAGSFVLNGAGEATGVVWLQEGGILENPIALTNTENVGIVHKAVVDWMLKSHPAIGIGDDTVTPVVLECDDSALNDMRGQHVSEQDVFKALESASGGPVAEGGVGAGTGMISYEFKGGIGTASRRLPKEVGDYVVGVLVNANHGERHSLRVLGAQVGQKITDLMPKEKKDGSIIAIVATNAPLDSRQLSRVAKRVFLGIARTGAIARHGSGDMSIAFSNGLRLPHYPAKPLLKQEILSDFWLNDLFEATADAGEEAVLNALLAAKTTVGRDGNTAYALPHDRLMAILKSPVLGGK